MFGLDQLNPQKLFDPPCPNWNVFEPSTKNGRFSWKKDSTSERLITAGSTSTWPKSGLIVAFNVRLLPNPAWRSAPKPGLFRDRVGKDGQSLRRMDVLQSDQIAEP